MKCCAFVALLLGSFCFAQTGRDYYMELYDAGGIDRMASQYVCFADKDVGTFFVFSETRLLREYMIANGTIKTLSKEYQAELKKDSLMFRGYDKGVPFSDHDYLDPDGTSWISERFMIEKNPARVRFSIAWATLRYKRTVELLNADRTVRSEVSVYGRCERISPKVEQHGK